MAARQSSVEPEEHIDFDGDNDMDDYDEEPAEDEGYRKRRRDESTEDEEERRYDDEDDDDDRRDEKDLIENEGNDVASGSEKKGEQIEDKGNQVELMADDEETKKRKELLALPPHGSEVFIGGLPRDTSEEELRDLCESYGDIFEVRLMKDKDTKESKGFAFIMFTNSVAAQKAIEGIHDKAFKGRTLRCSLSQAKHRLFVGNVPKNLNEKELRKIFDDSGPGVVNIEMFKDLQEPSRNRGFLFVEYYNHACADYSKEKMSNPNFKMDGSIPTVTWADPKNTGDSSAASQVKALYVKNLPENVSSEKLKELFERHGEVTKVVLPPSKTGQGKRDFGFIHFAERSSALKAVKGTEKYEIDGQAIEVALAKPQADKKQDHSAKPAVPNNPQYPVYGNYPDPYGAYGGFGQPMIYGRGPMPSGMRMVPMVLPDGRVGYVLQQPGGPPPPPPPHHQHHRRGDRSSGSGDGGGRSGDGNRGRRYRPY